MCDLSAPSILLSRGFVVASSRTMAIAPGLEHFHLLSLLLGSRTILGGDRNRLVRACISSLFADLLSQSSGDRLG